MTILTIYTNDDTTIKENAEALRNNFHLFDDFLEEVPSSHMDVDMSRDNLKLVLDLVVRGRNIPGSDSDWLRLDRLMKYLGPKEGVLDTLSLTMSRYLRNTGRIKITPILTYDECIRKISETLWD